MTPRADDDEDTLVSKLAAGFLGRLCLSGDPDRLSEAAWRRVTETLELYERAVPVIDAGVSRQGGTRPADAMRNPSGWQSVLRVSADGALALVVLHSFAGPVGPVTVPLPPGHWTVTGALVPGHAPLSVAGPRLRWQSPPQWSGAVALLAREN